MVASEASGSRTRDAVVRAGFSLSYFKQPGGNHETNFICYLLQLHLPYFGCRRSCATEANGDTSNRIRYSGEIRRSNDD
jgi:hypothetical protein